MNKLRRYNRMRKFTKKIKLAAWRQANPHKYAYQTLKDNAKRRGKEFTITYEEFLLFCYKYKYLDKKGIYRDSYGVDRIDEEKGYTYQNMCVKKNFENVLKYKAYDFEHRTAVTVTVRKTA